MTGGPDLLVPGKACRMMRTGTTRGAITSMPADTYTSTKTGNTTTVIHCVPAVLLK